MNYNECEVLFNLKRKDIPLISKVPTDEFTEMAQLNFDYEFDGISEFYPYELPSEILDMDYQILVICGNSGKGKSSLLKEFPFYDNKEKCYDSSKAIISNFETPQEATKRLSAVGLNCVPVWCRPRRVLSVGEGFRADIALRLNNETIFDEFTSTIDRNVAKGCCNGIQKYIRNNGLQKVVFCSCHKDYIPFLRPDIVIDLDDEKVYDCRGAKIEITDNKTNNNKGKLIGTISV